MITYEWLSGIRPFQGDPLAVIVQHRIDPPPSLCILYPELSLLVEQVLLKALNKAPTERFPSVVHFAEALQMALQGSNTLTTTTPNPLVPPNSLTTIVPSEETTVRMTNPSEIVHSSPPVSESSIDIYATSVEPPEKRPHSSPPDHVPETSLIKHPQVTTPRPGHRRRTLVALLCFVLLIMAGSGGMWLFLEQQHAQDRDRIAASLATAAANAYRTGTDRGVQFGFDAAHTNWNPYEQIINSTNVTQLATRWSYSTSGSVYISPTIANGVVYIASSDGKFYAFDATCRSVCQPLWFYQIGNANALGYEDFRSSPAVGNGLVYIGSTPRPFRDIYEGNATTPTAFEPVDGKLYAFDTTCRSSCQPLWSYSASHSTFSSPTVINGVVFVSSMTTNLGKVHNVDTTLDSKLYAFDATCRSACQPLWSYSFICGSRLNTSSRVAWG